MARPDLLKILENPNALTVFSPRRIQKRLAEDIAVNERLGMHIGQGARPLVQSSWGELRTV